MQDSLLKQCTKCKEWKNKSEFNKNNKTKDGLKCWCKDCTKADYFNHKKQYKQYREKHKDTRNNQHKQWYENNKEHCRNYSKKYYKNNIEQCKQISHNYTDPNWQNNYYNNIKLRRNFHKDVIRSLFSKPNKQHNCYEILNYNKEELKSHLESQFTPEMNWDNYGTYWEIDHIIPKNLFNYESEQDEQFQICWSLMNLRPLSSRINQSRPKDGSDISEEVKNKILGQNIKCGII